MDEIQYVGEHLLPGIIGNFALVLAFCTALLSAISYYYSTKPYADSKWSKMGRISFWIHGVSVITLIACIFYVMYNRMFEYRYVIEHVSDDLPMKYILSAFWEGQEGSFLLWMFWHVVLGFIFIRGKSMFESPVICILALIQLVLTSMLLGVYVGFGDSMYKLGSNPILLLRDTVDLPLFNNAEYVSLLKGNGLNPLLQNYWMTIHPPTLFLGFASTAFPFCLAIAGLWTKQHKAWLKPALRWSLFSGGILGIGILMGGAWAYEALTFGGYWAWDPVENTSLVPWIVLVAGIHTNLIAKSTGYSMRSTYAFYLMCFILILYSTFLTRSGILGDTSVHAFTEMGLEWQLVFMVVFFTSLAKLFFFFNWKNIPAPKTEEKFLSREFWMFIGALVLLFSAILITVSSSLPVFNKIMSFFDATYVGRVIEDPIPHYNKYQIWIGVFVALLSGISVFLRYGSRTIKLKTLFTHIAIGAILGVLLVYLFERWLGLHAWQYRVLMFACSFGVVSNLDYLISVIRGNLKLASSVCSHFGFSLMIIGVLASGLNEQVISSNSFLLDVEQSERLGNALPLYENIPMFMNGYWATYKGDTLEGFTRRYEVDIRKVDENNNTLEEYTMWPSAIYDKDMAKIAAFNPDKRHYWMEDIFVNAQVPSPKFDVKFAHEMEDTLRYNDYILTVGDTFKTENSIGILKSIDFEPKHKDFNMDDNDLGVGLSIEFQQDGKEEIYEANPSLGLKGNLVFQYPDKLDRLNMKMRIEDSFFETLFTPEQLIDFENKVLKQNETIDYKDFKITLSAFDRNPQNDLYEAQDGDIAIAAELTVLRKSDNKIFALDPIYVLREGRPFSIKDYEASSGLHVHFANINPQEENFEFKLGMDKRSSMSVPVQIAENMPATDFIIFEAKRFPGINFFWLGSTMMMLGLIFGFIRKLRNT